VTASTYERLKKIVVEQLGVDEDEVKPEASFVDDLNADSLDLVELIMSLEEEFGTEISDEDAEKIRTVGDAVEYIDNSRKTDGHPITREEIRELTRQNDPDLFADDAGANRDLHKRIERVYGEIKRDRVGRPSENGK